MRTSGKVAQAGMFEEEPATVAKPGKDAMAMLRMMMGTQPPESHDRAVFRAAGENEEYAYRLQQELLRAELIERCPGIGTGEGQTCVRATAKADKTVRRLSKSVVRPGLLVLLRKSVVRSHTRRVGGLQVRVRSYENKRIRKPEPAKPVPQARQLKGDDSKRTKHKFQQCLKLRRALPDLDRQLARDLARADTPRQKTAAAIVVLMRRLNLRVGSERYAQTHQTFGASSLRVEHVRIEGDKIAFNFLGKKAHPWSRSLEDPDLAKFLAHLQEHSPEGRLFWYRKKDKTISATETTATSYLRNFDVTPKDFRTYMANLRLFEELKKREQPEGASKSEVKRAVAEAFAVVAEELGHDVGTCRASYVFAPLWESFIEKGGRLTTRNPFSTGALKKALENWTAITPIEREFWQWLDDYGELEKSLVRGHYRTMGRKGQVAIRAYQRQGKPKAKEADPLAHEPLATRDTWRLPDGGPVLVERTGDLHNQRFNLFNKAGSRVAQLSVEIKYELASTGSGTQDMACYVRNAVINRSALRQGYFVTLLRKLVSMYGTLYLSTMRMADRDMREEMLDSVKSLGNDYEVTEAIVPRAGGERPTGQSDRFGKEETGGVPYLRVRREALSLFKGLVRAYTRQQPTGLRVAVRGYANRRTKKATESLKPRAKATEVQATDKIYTLGMAVVQPDPQQHRKLFDKAKLQELADSIRESGQKTPIVVQPITGHGKVKYQIIAGERRYRACKLLGIKQIKAVVREHATEEDILTEQVIENVNREQITPMEEATAYRQLADLYAGKARRRKKWVGKDFKDPIIKARLEDEAREWTARQTGKNQTHVTYYIKLTDLAPEVQEMVGKGQLTPRHGNILTRLTDNVDDPKDKRERLLHQVRMARHARAHGLTADILNGMVTEYVRQQEQQVMFSEEEATGGEKQLARQEQKAKLNRVVEALAEAIRLAFSEQTETFRPEVLTGGDLQLNLQKVKGAINTLEQITGVMEREMMAREAREAIKRRRVMGGPSGGIGAGEAPAMVAGTSLFGTMTKSLASLEARRDALEEEVASRGGRVRGGLLVRLRKRLRKAHFSAAEMKRMGLRWVTAHPGGAGTEGKPIIVKDLGDDESMVVGGAGGKMNYVRFKRPPGGFKKIDKRPTKQAAPLTVEQTVKLEEQKTVAGRARQEQETRLTQVMREQLKLARDLTPQERASIAKRAVKRAEKLGGSKQEADRLVQVALHEQEKAKRQAFSKTTEQVAHAAIDAIAKQELTGQPYDAEVQVQDAQGQTQTIRVGADQAAVIASQVFELRRARAQERAVERALKEGLPKTQRAVDLLTEPLSDERVRKMVLEEYVDRERVKINSQLADIADVNTVTSENAMNQGAVDAGAGMAAELTGETILNPETATRLGITGSARVIAHYLSAKAKPEDLVTAIQKFVATNGAATAATAVAKSEQLLQLGRDMEKAATEGGLLTKAQASGKQLEYVNESRKLCARALGALETMAQTALMLQQGVSGDMVLPGRGNRLATVVAGQELGLKEHEDFTVREHQGKQELLVKEAALDKLASPKMLDGWEADNEIHEIKARGRGDGWEDWKAEGQGEGVILSPHQQADIKFWEKQKSILVGDEAGSGKTAVALNGIAHLAKQGKVKKALVVVPKSVIQNFGKEAQFFLDPEMAKNYQAVSADKMNKARRKEAYQGDQLFTVITHDTLRNDLYYLRDAGFDAVIVDEAHYLTEREGGKISKRSQALHELNPEYKCLMSGTLVKNDLSELWSLADYVQSGVLGTRKEFMSRYGKLGETAGPLDASLLHSLQQRLNGVLIGVKLTTHKTERGREVLELKGEGREGVPVRLRTEERRVKLSPEQARQYRASEKFYLESKHEGVKGIALTKTTTQKRIVNNISPVDNPKVQAVRDIMAEHPDSKIIIFATNDYAIKTVKQGLGLSEGTYADINGGVRDSNRLKIAERVNTEINPKVLFCTDAANFGMNIQGANVVINFDTPDTQATVEQRVARAFRRKQKKDVYLYHVRSDTPLELKAARRLMKKKTKMDVVDQLTAADESGLAGPLYQYLQEVAT